MSLNQIIDPSPASVLSALVVDKTLNLKAEQIKVKTKVIADTIFANRIALNPGSPYAGDVPITIKLWDGADRNVVLAGPAPVSARFSRVGDITSVSIPNFTINSADVATGKIRIYFNIPLIGRFRPVSTFCAPIQGKNNGTSTTTPLLIQYDSVGHLFFEISANYNPTTNFTTTVTPAPSVPIGPDFYINLVYTSV